jgi:hypothetical protein
MSNIKTDKKNDNQILYSKLDISKIIFSKPVVNERSPSQLIGYINYEARPRRLNVQSPEFNAEAYGIPREDPKWYPDAHKRALYKLPFCHDRRRYANEGINYDKIKEFHDKLVAIDKKCSSIEFKKEMFGEDDVIITDDEGNEKTVKRYETYAYQPLVRTPKPKNPPSLDKNGKPVYLPKYAKIKLPLEYTDDSVKPVKVPRSTKPLFLIIERNEDVRKPIQLETFDDVVKMIKFRSNLRIVFNFSKLYAMTNDAGNGKFKYGITLKATHIEVKHTQNSQNNDPEDFAFVESEDEQQDEGKEQIGRKNTNLDEGINNEEDPVDDKHEAKSEDEPEVKKEEPKKEEHKKEDPKLEEKDGGKSVKPRGKKS